MTNLSPEARSLLSDLLTLASFKPSFIEGQNTYNQRRSTWQDCESASETAFQELEQLAKPIEVIK